MIDIIQSKTKDIIYKCCEKYAEKNKLSIDNVQLIFGVNEEGNTYTICESYAKKEAYTFMQVLGVKIDFLGYSQFAPNFILKALLRFANQYEIPVDKVQVMCVPTKTEDRKGKLKNDVKLFLYNGDDYVQTSFIVNEETKEEENGLSFSDLFNEEDIEMPTM